MQIRSRIVAKRIQTWRSARSARRDSSIGRNECHSLYGSESQANTLNHGHRRVTCIISRTRRSHETDRTADRIQQQNDRSGPNQAKTRQFRFNAEHQCIAQKVAMGKPRNCVSARSQTCRRARGKPRTRTRQLRADTGITCSD